MTLRQFETAPASVPGATSWYLADLGEARGKQELFTKQVPQKLKALRENALIESAVSSNRMEGVEVEPGASERSSSASHFCATAMKKKRGYRPVLELIHGEGSRLPISETTICRLHSLSRGGIGDVGQYKQSENDIIETFP